MILDLTHRCNILWSSLICSLIWGCICWRRFSNMCYEPFGHQSLRSAALVKVRPMLSPLPVAPSLPARAAGAQGTSAGWKASHLLPMTGLVFASYRRSGWVCHQRGPKVGRRDKMKDFRKEFLKKFGEDSIVDFSQTTAKTPVFSTGALTLDLALGGGLPYGKLVEIYGPEQSGKTTLALSCCVSLQKSGKKKACAFIDVEHALNKERS